MALFPPVASEVASNAIGSPWLCRCFCSLPGVHADPLCRNEDDSCAVLGAAVAISEGGFGTAANSPSDVECYIHDRVMHRNRPEFSGARQISVSSEGVGKLLINGWVKY